MKINTAFIIFVSLVLSFICLRSGMATTGQLPLSDKQISSAIAQQNEPVRAPFFQGEGLPTPPQQNAPWPHGADALSKAAATLTHDIRMARNSIFSGPKKSATRVFWRAANGWKQKQAPKENSLGSFG
jgi:hypothetical protein